MSTCKDCGQAVLKAYVMTQDGKRLIQLDRGPLCFAVVDPDDEGREQDGVRVFHSLAKVDHAALCRGRIRKPRQSETLHGEDHTDA